MVALSEQAYVLRETRANNAAAIRELVLSVNVESIRHRDAVCPDRTFAGRLSRQSQVEVLIERSLVGNRLT